MEEKIKVNVKGFEVNLYGQKELIGLVEWPNNQYILYFGSHDLVKRLNGLKGVGVTVFNDGETVYSGENEFEKELAKAVWDQIKDNLINPISEEVRYM